MKKAFKKHPKKHLKAILGPSSEPKRIIQPFFSLLDAFWPPFGLHVGGQNPSKINKKNNQILYKILEGIFNRF